MKRRELKTGVLSTEINSDVKGDNFQHYLPGSPIYMEKRTEQAK